MMKLSLNLLYILVIYFGIHTYFDKPAKSVAKTSSHINSSTNISGRETNIFDDKQRWPAGLTFTKFVGPEVTPSPACLAVAPTGEVFVGVDMIGSLGKEAGKGYIIKMIEDRKSVV